MGWAARLPRQKVSANDQLRALLAMFPDRATYEQWLEAQRVPETHRAHMEQLLPASLQAKGTV